MTDEQRLERNGCCAHLKVLWATEEVDGLTRGWWECSDCHSKFIPERAALAQLDAARQHYERTLKDLNITGAKLAASEQQVERLRKVLTEIGKFRGKTLIGNRSYSVGANRAFEECVCIAVAVLADGAQEKS